MPGAGGLGGGATAGRAGIGLAAYGSACAHEIAGVTPQLAHVRAERAAPLAVKARCAYYILNQTKEAIETEEIEARVTELERGLAQQESEVGT